MHTKKYQNRLTYNKVTIT